MIRILIAIVLFVAALAVAFKGKRHCISIACGWEGTLPSCVVSHGRDWSRAWNSEEARRVATGQPLDGGSGAGSTVTKYVQIFPCPKKYRHKDGWCVIPWKDLQP